MATGWSFGIEGEEALPSRSVLRPRPCVTFGTLRRPRLRSRVFPAGFDPAEPLTRTHTRIALRVGMLLSLIHAYQLFATCETVGSSCMYDLHIFRVLRGRVLLSAAFARARTALLVFFSEAVRVADELAPLPPRH